MSPHLVVAKVEFQTRLKNWHLFLSLALANHEHMKQQNKIIHRNLYFYSFPRNYFKSSTVIIYIMQAFPSLIKHFFK